MIIIKKISNNACHIGGNKPTWIVIHETDNEEKGAGALQHAKALANGNLADSAHFYVDDVAIVQVHELTDRAFHTGKLYGIPKITGINNENSIGIEICVNPDSNYNKAVQNAIELVKDILMPQLKINDVHVVRHFDSAAKNCPARMLKNPNIWVDFKNNLKEENKVKNIVVYSNDIDKRAAEYLADYLRCPTVHEVNIANVMNNVERIYVIGSDFKPTTDSTIIKGADRYETVKAVLKYMGKL